jgi:hypothetical protein
VEKVDSWKIVLLRTLAVLGGSLQEIDRRLGKRLNSEV